MNSGAYYNENDPYAAAWLRELIKRDLIAPGDVDERSIKDVRPDDLDGYTQCHFFAGIAGWSLALRLSGWPDDRAVWTGSCPCQPWSRAGRGGAETDPRDLWPTWFRLIRELSPAIVFGEQVDKAITHGWLDRLCDDMEAEGYACGAHVLPSCSVGADIIGQRLWWVASSDCERVWCEGRGPSQEAPRAMQREGRQRQRVWADPRASRATVVCSDGRRRRIEPGTEPLVDGLSTRVERCRAYGNAIDPFLGSKFITAYMECAA